MSILDKHLDKLVKISPLAAAFVTAIATTHAQAREIVVTSKDDDSGKSLYEAMLEASFTPDDDKIVFDSSLSGKNIPMQPVYLPYDSGALVINGSGAPGMTIKATTEGFNDCCYPVVIEAEGIDLTVKNLNIEINNAYSDGGFIDIQDANLELDNVVIKDKSKVSESELEVLGKAENIRTYVVYSEYSTISMNNTLVKGTGEFYAQTSVVGGEDNIVDISNSILTDNFGVTWLKADAEGSTSLSIENSVISGNGVVDAEGYSRGFGIEVYGYGNAAASLTISNSTIANNISNYSEGAAVAYANNGKLDVEIFNTVIANNEITEGGASALSLTSHGAADIVITHSTIVGNTMGYKGSEEEEGNSGSAALYTHVHASSKTKVSNSIIVNNMSYQYPESEGNIYELEPADTQVDDENLEVIANLIGVDWSNEAEGGVFTKKDGNIITDNPGIKDGVVELEGAAVPTVCLEKDSPARNSANIDITKSFRLYFDQLGADRLKDGAPDMGALEYTKACEGKKKGGGSDGLFGSMGAGVVMLLTLIGFRRRK